jgi:hypothetical protein
MPLLIMPGEADTRAPFKNHVKHLGGCVPK